ncbi:MAG: helix-turn-helix transcriptional regulator [Bacillota bacterium]|nr:helix-turn-helix transcriptional regulator [Bacillota bacterium]
MSRVGEKIKQLRLESGMNQKQLGKKLGVSESFVLEVETGRRVINENLMNRIAKVLGKDINDINMHDDEDNNKPPVVNKEIKIDKKGKNKDNDVNEVWSNALSSILKNVPVYRYDLNKPIAVKQMPVISNKIEGHSQDKVAFLTVEQDDMTSFRICRGDIAFGYVIHEVENNSICLVEYNNIRAIRQIKKLDSNKVLLISNGGNLRTETVNVKEIRPLLKLQKLEITL